jgi:hypothetical protein
MINGVYGQKRYGHIPRTKIKKESITIPVKNQLSEPVISTQINTTENPEQIKENPSTQFNTGPEVDKPVVVKLENETPKTYPSVILNHKKYPSIVSQENQQRVLVKKTALKIRHVKPLHPSKTSMDSDELDLMAWISLVACITFIGGVVINFILGGFSTIVIVFIILSAVFAVATVIFFVLSNTIGE